MKAIRVQFADRLEPGAAQLLAFADPAPRFAVLTDTSAEQIVAARGGADRDFIDIIILPIAGGPESAGDSDMAVEVTIRGARVTWRPGRAVVRCGTEQSQAMALAIVEFSYYERELRHLEHEIAASWDVLERDKRLAFDVQPGDLADQAVIGQHVSRTLGWRIRHSRISPRVYQPGAELPEPSRELGEELREQADVEERLELVDGHLEVFEHVYEMVSQRIGEFRASHQEQRLERLIIILLAAETLLLLYQVLIPH